MRRRLREAAGRKHRGLVAPAGVQRVQAQRASLLPVVRRRFLPGQEDAPLLLAEVLGARQGKGGCMTAALKGKIRRCANCGRMFRNAGAARASKAEYCSAMCAVLVQRDPPPWRRGSDAKRN